MSMRGRRQPKRAALEFIYTGNGSASFDPSITTSVGVNVSWKPDDAPETVTSGTTHNFSYTPSAGYHKCKITVLAGLRAVTAITADVDSIQRIKTKPLSVTTVNFFNNVDMPVYLSTFPLATSIDLYQCDVIGSLPQIARNATLIGLRTTQTKQNLSGSLSDLPVTSLDVYLYGRTTILPASIAHLNAIRDIRIYSMWPSLSAADSVDIVINSIYAARANYTYATGPSLQIGGTNAAPTGNYTDPTVTPGDGNSNSDWSWNGTYHVPLTPKAKIYYLVNGPDHGTDTFYLWSITFTT